MTETTTVTFRSALPADTERIASIMFDDPGREATALCFNDEDLARRLSQELVRMPGAPMGWERTVLAEVDGEAVGVLQADRDGAQVPVTPAMLIHLARLFGPVKVVRAWPRLRARRRVDFVMPVEALIVHELHVHPQDRNRGVGGAMLTHAEEQALQERAPRMALTTHMANPARHLYERHGFRIADTRTDAAYERYTGIPGRYLMVKELP